MMSARRPAGAGEFDALILSSNGAKTAVEAIIACRCLWLWAKSDT
jgi:hypothetical protein